MKIDFLSNGKDLNYKSPKKEHVIFENEDEHRNVIKRMEGERILPDTKLTAHNYILNSGKIMC